LWLALDGQILTAEFISVHWGFILPRRDAPVEAFVEHVQLRVLVWVAHSLWCWHLLVLKDEI